MTAWGFTTFFFGFGALWYSVYFIARRDLEVFKPTAAAAKTGKALVGLAIAFVGLVAMTARTEAVVLEGLALMLVAAAFFAANAVAVKRFTKIHAPIHLAYYRAIALALLMIAYSLTLESFRLPRGNEWLLLALVGFIGPFLNYLCFFNALKRLAIGRVSIVRMCYSVLVVIGAYAIYAQLPMDRQILGGVVLLAGVGLVVHRPPSSTVAGRD
jgi:drug/metabolite transporter (DMT)-like permease